MKILFCNPREQKKKNKSFDDREPNSALDHVGHKIPGECGQDHIKGGCRSIRREIRKKSPVAMITESRSIL
jgi:hypothetical protein